MTTIAVTDTHIAADGRCSSDDAVFNWVGTKIIKVDDRIFAVCGSAGHLMPLAKWYEAGAKIDDMPVGNDDGWTLLVIDRQGMCFYTNECPYPTIARPPFAMGSGEKIAIGAMEAGASAEHAVRIACKYDVHSGEPIQVIDIKQALGIKEPGLRIAKG